MENNTPKLFALTPIDQTEGLEDGIYTVIDKEGNKKDYYYSNDYFVNREGDEGFHKHCGDGKFYLRPLPAGTEVLKPGMVALSLTTIQEVKKAFSDYVKSEGCSCCRDINAHDEAALRMGELLGFEKYEDGSGYNFY